MSQVSMAWTGSELQAGFQAVTRQEYLGHLEKLAAFADLIWPPVSDEAPADVESVAAIERRLRESEPRPDAARRKINGLDPKLYGL